MDFEKVSMPAMPFMGVELRTTFKNNECFSAIPAFWQKQKNEPIAQKISHKVYPDVTLGLYTNYTPDFSLTGGHYSFIIGSVVKNTHMISHGMVAREIPTANYAVFTVKGPFNLIGEAWLEIWKNQKIARTFTNDFEWYDSKSTNDANSIVKIYVGIK